MRGEALTSGGVNDGGAEAPPSSGGVTGRRQPIADEISVGDGLEAHERLLKDTLIDDDNAVARLLPTFAGETLE